MIAVNSKKIMVVEDEGIVSIDLRHILTKRGYSVPAVAFSGEEAVQKALESKPDLILMDIGLKGIIDGVEAARRIQSRFGTPIIFLTGFADEKTIQRAQSVKCSGYIFKPINEEELQNVISHVFGE